MRIVFEFVGGSRDGQTEEYDSSQSRTDRSEVAQGYYWITKHGSVDSRFWAASEMSLEVLQDGGQKALYETGMDRAEKYEVVNRLEDGKDVWVQCRFVGYTED